MLAHSTPTTSPVTSKHREVRIALRNANKMRGDDFLGQVWHDASPLLIPSIYTLVGKRRKGGGGEGGCVKDQEY